MQTLTLNLSGSDARLIGDAGLDFSAWSVERPELLTALTDPAPGYTKLPDSDLSEILAFAAQTEGKYDDLLLLGIGGSALGARMLNCAFVEPADNRLNRPRLRTVDNVDPRRLGYLLKSLNPRRTLVVVVTKSGSTAETMASFAIAQQWLRESLGDGHQKRIVAVTDPTQGDLRRLVNEEGYGRFAVPTDVGGRFSALSTVGLLPAALLGIDIKELLTGAARLRETTLNPDWQRNPALALALTLHEHHNNGRRIVSVMPYADGLRDFALWFVQLWAESLGKRADYGPTPLSALGATDQHSQLQLYTEGPKDKVVWLLSVSNLGEEIAVPPQSDELASLGYLSKRGLGELLAAELRGTTLALSKAGTPSLTLALPQLDERELGGLIYLAEAAVSITGELARLNPYDQPGVEDGKQATYALMGRPGYEDRLKEDEALESRRDGNLTSRA